MAKMNDSDQQAFDHFIKVYKHQWDLNEYFREQYDEDFDYYIGYRDERDYPLHYNMVFNKLLPKVYTLLSRFMDQLYRRSQHDIAGVRPRKRQDVPRAPRVQGLLNYQLETLNNIDEQGGSFLFNFHWLFNAINWGKGIAKCYWRKEERIAPNRVTVPIPQFDEAGRLVDIQARSFVVESPQIVYDAPYAEVLHPKLFVGHPHFKSIQKMPAAFCVYRRSMDYLKEMEEKGIYRNIDLVGASGPQNIASKSATSLGQDSAQAISKSIDIEAAYPVGESDSDRGAPFVDVIEGYGRYIFPEDDTPYEVGSGIKIKGRESEAIVHIGNYRTILSIQKNNYGMRPLFDIGAYYHPELFWDIGLIRLGKTIQEQYNNLANVRYQNAIQIVNQMLKVRQDADIDPEALEWKPYGIIPVEDMSDVEPLIQNDMTQTGVFREQEQFFEDTLSDMLGMYAYSQGQIPQRQEYVGTVYSLQAMGEARTKLLLMMMDFTGFQPFLKHMMRLNVWHLPDGFEARINSPDEQGTQFVPLFGGDIHVDYDFTARYTALEPALAKEFRMQQLLQFSSYWRDSPYLNQHQFGKAVLEMMDFQDNEKYWYSPQQVAQMQQQQQQQMMQTQLMGAAVSDSLAAKQSEREMMRDVVKGLIQ